MSLGHYYGGDEDDLQKEVEYLVTLDLPQLQSLELKCCNVLPLLESRWPNLTKLNLEVEGEPVEYPEEIQFPIISLKGLTLRFVDSKRGRNDTCLAAFLKSCPKLTKLEICDSNFCDEVFATAIISAPLLQLESLKIWSDALPGFFPKVIEGNWPNLKRLKTEDTDDNTTLIPRISSQVWVTNVEELYLCYTDGPVVTSPELHTFMRELEKGAIQRLTLHNLNLSSLLDGFATISLSHLKELNLNWLNSDIDISSDISRFINIFFDSRSLPKLEQLTFKMLMRPRPQDRYKWDLPPRTTGPRQPIKYMSFNDLNMSRDVASYLGNFIKHAQTGCQIRLEVCFVPEVELSSERKELLNKLGLTLKDWQNFCDLRRGPFYVPNCPYEKCMYWGLMSDGQFKRIAYATLLKKHATIMTDLAKFIRLVETEEVGSVMKNPQALEILKNTLEQLWTDFKRTGEETRLEPWKVQDFIDFTT